MIVKLTEADIEKILDVEKRAFIPPLQAERNVISNRLKMNHVYLGAQHNGELVGALAFRYGRFSSDNFPKKFHEFADNPNAENPNAIFAYSLGIVPEHRNKGYALKLIESVRDCAKTNNVCYIIGDGRCPSYEGSAEFEQEKIKQNIEFKNAIDEGIRKGILPKSQDLVKDSTLAFYHRFVKADFLFLIPDFIPEDKPAGGHRVIIGTKL
jgi:GNAT superfamily N-acetyltransferase